jgi:hypothetical protein
MNAAGKHLKGSEFIGQDLRGAVFDGLGGQRGHSTFWKAGVNCWCKLTMVGEGWQ